MLTDHVGWRWVFLVNLPAGAVDLAFIARMPRLGGATWLRPCISPPLVRMLVIVAGLGLGPTIPIVVVAVQSAVLPRDLGIATAATRFFRQLGATAGIAVLGTVFTHTLAARPGPPLDPETLSLALRSVYAVACAVAAAGFLVTPGPARRASPACLS